MEFKAFFVVALLFFIMLVPFVSATPARDTAIQIQNLLDKETPYTIEITEAQMNASGRDAVNLTHRGTYKITIKSATYNATEETLVMHINAWRNGQSVKVNNPWHFYMPWVGGIIGANANQQLANHVWNLITILDSKSVV